MSQTPDPAAQGGGQSQGGASAQSATAGGDVKQMRVDDLINIANQQNIDVSPVTEIIAQVEAAIQANPSIAPNISPEIGNVDTGDNTP